MPSTIGAPSLMPHASPPPKSGWASPKSRKMAGTRSTHAPLTFSHWGSCLQVKPFSSSHVDEQPSPSKVLPSSQPSLMTMPSPHSDVHDCPWQLGSRRHKEEQPSNGMLLPSSQLSAPSTMALPHCASEQTLGEPSHFFPSSILHRSEQPSPAVVLPSSQRSLAATTPSPHRAISRQALPGLAQLNPRSTSKHVSLQPSPDTLLPSSHASSSLSSPLPQLGGAWMSLPPVPRMGPVPPRVGPVPAWVPLPVVPPVPSGSPVPPGPPPPALHAAASTAKITPETRTGMNGRWRTARDLCHAFRARATHFEVSGTDSSVTRPHFSEESACRVPHTV
jgi:hypothetical protein